MRRSRHALLLIAFASAYCEVATAQPAAPSSPPAAPSAPARSAPPPPAAPPSSAPAAQNAPARTPPPVAQPAAPSSPPAAPAAQNAPARTLPPGAAPAAPNAPPTPSVSVAPGSPEAAAENAAPSAAAVPAAPTQASEPATQADDAPAPDAAAATPEARTAEQRRPSFLEAHPTGYLPSLYRRDSRVHRGFSVRISAGLGYGIMRRRVTDSTSYKVRGLEGQLSLDIGASVIDNLIVFGRFSGFAWNSVLESDSRNAGGAYLGLLGAGARYYLMPANAFASAAIGVAALQVLNDLGVSQNANPGFGMELEVGKDFWAGTPLDQRGIGLALRFGWVHCGAVARGDEELKPWNSYSVSVLFSAAYN